MINSDWALWINIYQHNCQGAIVHYITFCPRAHLRKLRSEQPSMKWGSFQLFPVEKYAENIMRNMQMFSNIWVEWDPGNCYYFINDAHIYIWNSWFFDAVHYSSNFYTQCLLWKSTHAQAAQYVSSQTSCETSYKPKFPSTVFPTHVIVLALINCADCGMVESSVVYQL